MDQLVLRGPFGERFESFNKYYWGEKIELPLRVVKKLVIKDLEIMLKEFANAELIFLQKFYKN